MRIFLLVCLVALAIATQTHLAPKIALVQARPDWLLALVVYAALYLPPPSAILLAWTLGLCADLSTVERIGVHGLPYLLLAAGIVGVRDSLFVQSAWARFLVTLTGALFVQLCWLVYRALSIGSMNLAAEVGFVGAAIIYSALWSIPIHAVLIRLHRRRHRSWGHAGV